MWQTDALSVHGLIFLSGLFGGFGHCLGMCGPIVAAFSLASPHRAPVRPLLYYNLGRITTYAVAGGAVALAGSLLPAVAGLSRLQDAVGIGTGLLVALLGLRVAGGLPAAGRNGSTGPVAAFVGRIVDAFAKAEGPGAYFPLGMVLGLLPCGLVYGALLSAAREGMAAGTPAAGFANGFLLMVLFGAGTAPALLLAGTAAAVVGPRLRCALARAAGVAMTAAGLLFAVRAIWR